MQKNVFQKTVWHYYKKHGRSLPWRPPTLKLRGVNTAYKILVSEVMLQQTQVDRILPKYKLFVKKFKSFEELAKATTSDVIKEWQGLGYNRRALNLKRAAEVVVKEHKGKLPRDYDQLVDLPSIGPYTAGALLTFIWNEPMVCIETNIRTVYLHHFFKDKKGISDKTLENLLAETLDATNPREWYYALMDYGSYLKKTIGNPNTKSKHYTKQSKFKGSNRELRGTILRLLSKSPATEKKIIAETKRKSIEVRQVLQTLIKEGFISKTKTFFELM
ncbi:MAG: A/G-specific adenine glycosylase [Patescibacteria group bacterium]